MATQPNAGRNRLTPWYIGLAIVVLSSLFVTWRMWASDCGTPMALEIGVTLVMPAVYLVLMYLTFTSQE
ncbi:hypothetical protein ACLB6G_09185 [Zhengella sp. ZM62]|uniref:hypothetical protein n=1 Tax=Zhengella sedimenti TaxID=3390035 RepID=UPI0039747166